MRRTASAAFRDPVGVLNSNALFVLTSLPKKSERRSLTGADRQEERVKGSRLRHRDWGLDIIWGVRGTCKGPPAMQVMPESQRGGGSHQAEAWRQERAEGPAGQLAPLGGPGFKTKINLGEPERRKERNKQTSRASACMSPN